MKNVNINMIFEELGHIQYMVNESNSELSSNIVLEAFWSIVGEQLVNEGIGSWLGKAGASVYNAAKDTYNTASNAVGGAINWAVQFGKDQWEKITKLGAEFVQFVKDIPAKVKGFKDNIVKNIKDGLHDLGVFLAPYIQKINQAGIDISDWLSKNIFEPIIKAIGDVQGFFTVANLNSILTDLKKVIDEKGASIDKSWHDNVVIPITNFINAGLSAIKSGAASTEEFLKKWIPKLGKAIYYIALTPFAIMIGVGKIGVALYNVCVKEFGDCKKAFNEGIAPKVQTNLAGTRPEGTTNGEFTGESRRTVMTYERFINRK